MHLEECTQPELTQPQLYLFLMENQVIIDSPTLSQSKIPLHLLCFGQKHLELGLSVGLCQNKVLLVRRPSPIFYTMYPDVVRRSQTTSDGTNRTTCLCRSYPPEAYSCMLDCVFKQPLAVSSVSCSKKGQLEVPNPQIFCYCIQMVLNWC